MVAGFARYALPVAALWAVLASPSPGSAQHDHAAHASPYAGQENRVITSLSAEEIAGLRAGEGLGYAKAAELNGLPGPAHLLEMRDTLGLDARQVAEIEAIFAAMHDESVTLGTELIRREAELDSLFREPDPEPAKVRELTDAIAGIEGRLRATHLLAHLRTRPLLTDAQVARYAQLRGYGAGSDPER